VPGSPLSVELVEHITELETLRPDWDRLAVAAGRPFAMSAWMLAWWRHCRPADAELRVIAVRRGPELIGLAPWYCQGEEFRLLGAELFVRLAPLSLPGVEEDAARAISARLARLAPTSIWFEQIDADCVWPSNIASAWPGQPPVRLLADPGAARPTPSIELNGKGYQRWIDSRPPQLRKRLRVAERRTADRAGRVIRCTAPDQLERAVRHLGRMHRVRWPGRAAWIDAEVEAMISDAARELADGGGARLFALDVDGEIAGVDLSVAAGGTVIAWTGSYDPRYADLSPGTQTLLAAIEEACNRGDRRVDLGTGAQPWKRHYADADRPLATIVAVPGSIRAVRKAAQLQARQAVGAARALARPLKRALPRV
jgi:CelD/BcsL family acetyltransferase involved in cellulose biosynthesis